MTESTLPQLFERARAADIEAVAGVKLFRAGRRLRGECPLCGASKGKKNGGAFSADPEARVFKCWGCGAGGDVIRLEMELRGGSPRQAAERLVGPVERQSVSPAVSPRRVEPARPSGGDQVARELWAEAVAPIAGTLAEIYLMGRGIDPAVIALAGGRLRFHPRAKYAWDEARGDWIRAPALVARVVTPGGPTRGVHATYLSADGRRKAALDPAKRMWGPQSDGEGRPGGSWLSDPTGKGPLIVGEGIETTFAAAQLHGLPCRMVAALALTRLQGGWVADKWGRIDPAMLASDPEKPAFTWPEPKGAPWGEVLVAVDRDMSPIKIKVRKLGGGTVQRAMDGEERARVCAGLAVQAWRRTTKAKVRAIAPAAGRDFSDELVARLAAGERIG